jgi:hypothetical protein
MKKHITHMGEHQEVGSSSLSVEPWVPAAEGAFEIVVQDLGAGLEQQVCASWRPLPLLLLGEPLAHHLVDRGFDEGRADRFRRCGCTLDEPLRGRLEGFPQDLSSAKTSAQSRRTLLKAVLMLEPTEERSRHDTRVTRETMASDRGWR